MNRRLIPLLLVPAAVASLLTGAHLLATEPAQDSGIKRAMSEINRAIKALDEGIDKDSVDATLGHLLSIEKAILDAKGQTPPSAEEEDEKKRERFVAEYRVLMLDLLKQVCDAEAAVVQGKYRDAEKIIGKLDSTKSRGHGKFNPR
jgi:soluble cytochrome b562